MNTTTRVLCAAAHLDPLFRQKALELYQRPFRAHPFELEVDIERVLENCRRARRRKFFRACALMMVAGQNVSFVQRLESAAHEDSEAARILQELNRLIDLLEAHRAEIPNAEGMRSALEEELKKAEPNRFTLTAML